MNEQNQTPENLTTQQGADDQLSSVVPSSPKNEEPASTSESSGGIGKKIRIIAESFGLLLIIILLVAVSDQVPRSKYEAIEQELTDANSSLAVAQLSLESVQNSFDDYKDKMSVFENLSDDEINALVAEADTILAEKKAAEEQAAQEEAERSQAIASATFEQSNALKSAQSYLKHSSFSYNGLIEQLEFEGYSAEAATYAADYCGADWNEQAAKTAQSYIDSSSFSRSGLIDQLLFEGFTQEQAEYGVTAVGY